MRLPRAAHTSRPWRIHEIAPEFEVEDVWALPTPGGPDDFPRLVREVTAAGPSGAAGALLAVRAKAGALLGWDHPGSGIGARVASLRVRLPADLRDAPAGPAFGDLPFRPLYLTDDEFAAEIANRTMHGVIHLGWVPDGPDRYRGQLAILVRRNGLLGAAYLAAIKPVRLLVVYPSWLRQLGRRWRDGGISR